MRKNTIKTIAIFACVAILLATVPSAFAIEKKANKFDLRTIVKKPVALIYSILSFLPVFDNSKTVVTPDNNKYGKKIKITGLISTGRPSDED
ncbi:MAG: hypothetical protein DRJ11_08960 [Candidatus Aminicenantes bacterium]|nr:MAG: hypothetical protein DRJ11_08960 [Candidatus Aminicenantes bacterium]